MFAWGKAKDAYLSSELQESFSLDSVVICPRWVLSERSCTMQVCTRSCECHACLPSLFMLEPKHLIQLSLSDKHMQGKCRPMQRGSLSRKWLLAFCFQSYRASCSLASRATKAMMPEVISPSCTNACRLSFGLSGTILTGVCMLLKSCGNETPKGNPSDNARVILGQCIESTLWENSILHFFTAATEGPTHQDAALPCNVKQLKGSAQEVAARGRVTGLKIHKVFQAEQAPRHGVRDLIFRQNARCHHKYLQHFAQRVQTDVLRFASCTIKSIA